MVPTSCGTCLRNSVFLWLQPVTAHKRTAELRIKSMRTIFSFDEIMTTIRLSIKKLRCTKGGVNLKQACFYMQTNNMYSSITIHIRLFLCNRAFPLQVLPDIQALFSTEVSIV